MERKIIKITPAVEEFSITWLLDKFCNYDCMYCGTEYHDNKSKSKDLETLKKAWNNIILKTSSQNLKFKISFTGGEPTANKNFLSFINWLRLDPRVSNLLVTSNGSASVRYYQNLLKNINSLSLSTHSEFMDESEFFDKCRQLDQVVKEYGDKTFHVNVMNERWNQDRIKLYIKYLEKHDILYSLSEIDYSIKIRDNFVEQGKKNIEEIL